MSDTGYLYLSFAELNELVLVHLISGVDQDIDIGGDYAVATSITGYTEWISEGRQVSIGWDWPMLATCGAAPLRRASLPNSNVMLQTPVQTDLGPRTTAQLLGSFVDRFDWQTETLRYISVSHDT